MAMVKVGGQFGSYGYINASGGFVWQPRK
jgi:hypothetical protein